jgi:hypothetical protein
MTVEEGNWWWAAGGGGVFHFENAFAGIRILCEVLGYHGGDISNGGHLVYEAV